MSPSAFITTRQTQKSGVRYVVRFRAGGRVAPLIHAGSFKTLREARARRDFIAGELAAGRDPRVALRALIHQAPRQTYAQAASSYQTSRIDLNESTLANITTHLGRLLPIFGASDPLEQTVQQQMEAVAVLAAELKPSSIVKYWDTHRKILDFAGVDPNPARHRTVKLPASEYEEVSPPTATHVLAIFDNLGARWLLPLITIEQTAMAISETIGLAWGDVDIPSNQFRLRRATVKAGIRARARWVQVPAWLMEHILDTCPPEDRTEARRVFPGIERNAARKAMARACKVAGIPVYSPHDLRHRRISLWHGQGIPQAELAKRAGHTKPSMTLDVYSHVMPLEEVPMETLEQILSGGQR